MFYKTVILLLLVFALGHMIYALAAFTEVSEPALWFFSAALGLLFAAFLNYLNLVIADKRIYRLTLMANCLLLLFLTALVITLVEPQTIGVATVSVLVTIAGLAKSPT